MDIVIDRCVTNQIIPAYKILTKNVHTCEHM